MHVVALTDFRGDIEVEAQALAPLLGGLALDAKMRLRGPLPRILFRTHDAEHARHVRDGVAARGHSAIVCRADEAFRTNQMVKLHRFTIDAAGLSTNDGATARLPWSELGAVIVARVQSHVARNSWEQVDQGEGSSPVRRETTNVQHASTYTAYLFPHSRAASPRPWLLDETDAQFLALGAKLQPTRMANFLTTVAMIRSLAPEAVVDDRFVHHPLASAALVSRRDTDSREEFAPGAMVDLTVHILARWLMREGSPYRGV